MLLFNETGVWSLLDFKKNGVFEASEFMIMSPVSSVHVPIRLLSNAYKSTSTQPLRTISASGVPMRWRCMGMWE
jgi:hypothetical protein